MNMTMAGTLRSSLAALVLMGAFGVACAQQVFSSPEAAADALVEAIAAGNQEAYRNILGADWPEYIPTDDVGEGDVQTFLEAWRAAHTIEREGDATAHLAVGPDDWTLPIPIAKDGDGWRFDTRAGAEEIRTRRIGRNELAAIQAALAYFDAQQEYAEADRNGDGSLEYAQRIVSTPGTRDGLYWAVLPGEEDSPLGPLFGTDRPGENYHGYQFRILEGQGEGAPDGAYDYRIKGRMVAGFGLVAWPSTYGDTGVMTFLVSHRGVVYQKNLGPDTDAIARNMRLFNPDSTWTPVEPLR